MKTQNYLYSDLMSEQLTKSYNSLGYMPNPDKVISSFGNGYDVLRELRNDPHVWSCLQSRKSGSMMLDYKLILPENKNSILNNQNINNQVSQMINNLDLESLYSDILDAIFFGFQPIEITWERTNNLIMPIRLDALPQEYFVIDNYGQPFIKKSNFSNQNTPILKHKLINIRHEFNYSNPYGTALLSKCYWSVKFKNGGTKLWVSFMEKYGMPLLLGKVRRGASFEESEKLAEELANMCEDAVIVTPADVEINLHEATKSSSVELYSEMIKFCNSEISKIILSQTLTSDVHSGSYAASKTHNEIRKDVIKKDVRLIEKALNELIKYFVEINYPKDYENLNLSKNIPIFRLKMEEVGD